MLRGRVVIDGPVARLQAGNACWWTRNYTGYSCVMGCMDYNDMQGQCLDMGTLNLIDGSDAYDAFV